jgi:hypothetical protein
VRGLARLTGATAAVVIAAGLTASGYLKFGLSTGSGSTALHWTGPVRYFVTERAAQGVSPIDLDAALGRAFDTWEAVPTANLRAERVGFTTAEPFETDGLTVLGFQSRPEFERTLGATTFTIDERTGEILEADIFFNTAFPWSTAAGGQVGRFDLQSIALHEIGHLLGLGHSALGETEVRPGGGRRVIGSGSVMFPIAFSPGSLDGRNLQPDDIAGVSDLYDTSAFRESTGSIAGTVTKDGHGVFGAHVAAFNLRTGALVAAFTLTGGGTFSIAGLDPGPTVLRVEPLDDGDVDSFFEGEDVDVDFKVTFARDLVVVPRGGSASGVKVDVESK